MDNFSSSRQFFEYHIRSVVFKILKTKFNGGEFTFHSNLKTKFCKLGVFSKSKVKRCINKPCLKDSTDLIVTLFKKDLGAEDILAIRDEIPQNTALKKYVVTPGDIGQFNNIHFCLNKKVFINDVIQQIILSCSEYGQEKQPSGSTLQQYLIYNGNILMDYTKIDQLSVGHLRTLLLSDHIVELLQQNRSHTVTSSSAGYSFMLKDGNLLRDDLLKVFGILCDRPEAETVSPSELETVKNSLESKLFQSQYRAKDDNKKCNLSDSEKSESVKCEQLNKQSADELIRNVQDHTNSTMVNSSEEKQRNEHGDLPSSENVRLTNVDTEMCTCSTRNCQNIQLNIPKFIEDLKKVKGDCLGVPFDKNLKDIEVTPIWNELFHLESLDFKTKIQNNKDEKINIVYIFGQEKRFQFQKIAIAWLMLSSSSLPEKQRFLCHSSVAFLNKKTSLSGRVSALEYMRIRTKQVKHSYFMKYGSVVDDDKWRTTITKMAIAVIKLEILFFPLKYQVKLDVTDTNECPSSCRQALFVLYNCARLAKIMEHYNEAVEKALYPPLPEINEVDFSLLNDEAEWNLFMRYLVIYPDIVADLIQSLEETSVAFGSNKIAQFLVSLSQDVSSYYSRVHILSEPRLHLFPVMFARLYLVKALHQVMQNALQLLNIETIDQM